MTLYPNKQCPGLELFVVFNEDVAIDNDSTLKNIFIDDLSYGQVVRFFKKSTHDLRLQNHFVWANPKRCAYGDC